jgi:hypothetical protein
MAVKTQVNTDSTQTLTNKTLTAPIIATISNTGTLTLPSSTDVLVGRATTDTLTNKTLSNPVLSGSMSGNGSLATTVTVPGTLIAGTSAVQSPFAANTKTTQAHGLGQIPTLVILYQECLIAEHGYSPGDRVYELIDWAGNHGAQSVADATNVYILSNQAVSPVMNKTTPAGFVVPTAANWKMVAVPYRLV